MTRREEHTGDAGRTPPRRTFLRQATGLAAVATAGVPFAAAGCRLERPDPAGDEGAGSSGPAIGSTRSALSVPGPMLPPVPSVLLTVSGAPGDPDEISVVWSFVLNGEPAHIGISVGDEHVAGGLIERAGEFVLNVPVASMIDGFDRVDMNSSRIDDKFALSGFTRGAATIVDAPVVEESPLHLECRVIESIPLPPARTVFFAEVVATTVLEGVVDADERLIVDNVPFFGMTAGSGEFYTMGEPIGHIGQSVGRTDIRY
jgi:flavin reductase (DIM6/NTAB) family NADH-FMN oxidoreductase RutF